MITIAKDLPHTLCSLSCVLGPTISECSCMVKVAIPSIDSHRSLRAVPKSSIHFDTGLD